MSYKNKETIEKEFDEKYVAVEPDSGWLGRMSPVVGQDIKADISKIRNQDLESLKFWAEKQRNRLVKEIDVVSEGNEKQRLKGGVSALEGFITHLNSLSEDNK